MLIWLDQHMEECMVGWMITAGIIMIFLILGPSAPYGRHVRNGWGPTLPAYIGWFIYETPALLGTFIFFYLFQGKISAGTAIPLVLWGVHYTYRAWIYPFRIRSRAKHMPYMIAISAILFNLGNTTILGWSFAQQDPISISEWISSWHHVLGLAVFGLGMFINHQGDAILLSLRKTGESHYSIPYGGFFRYVSSPNLLGEIMEWIGFAILSWHLGAVTFAVWTMANLIPRAMENHRWYRKSFEDYPKDRKILIPYLW